MKKIIILIAFILFLIQLTSLQKVGATLLATTRVASSLSRPVFVTSPPGDTARLFIVEQQTARIKILTGGSILPTSYLDINDLVIDTGNERGLLGLAFHPDYANNGYFFVDYVDNSGNTVIARFKVSSDANVADRDSFLVLLTITQPYENHKGGMLAFGPNDGYLYIGMGDGGSGGDPENRAQDDGQLLGKMLRIDVDHGSPYAIPPDNPFNGPGLPLDEIWAKGLRNPWRYSFDRLTGNLFIADVGQNLYEEINFQPASSSGGENYGWRLMEGNHCYNPPVDCDPGGLTYPIYEYTHGGTPSRCAVTGGYVYRGNAIPNLSGTYFFGDYCSGQVWSFRYDGIDITKFTERTTQLVPGNGLSINNISSFGEDGAGNLYIVDLDGEVYRITWRHGDVNDDETLDVGDVVYLIEYLFRGGPAPAPLESGDTNCDGVVNAGDVVFLINYLFKGGPASSC
jgi:glucose/arabinose dehydrogenase